MKTPIQEVFAHLRASKEDDSLGAVMTARLVGYAVDWLLENEKSLLEKEKEQMAYNSVRAIVEFQNNKNVELIEHPTELGSYHLRGEKEEVDKVLYGETFNTKKR
jgi:uncharacterized protein YbcV (DUF1398 family)